MHTKIQNESKKLFKRSGIFNFYFKWFIYTCMRNTIQFYILAAVILLLSLSGCRTKSIYVPIRSSSSVTESRRDTFVEARLQPMRDSVITFDSLSVLENMYASSVALWSGGRLSHSLVVKEVPIPVRVEYVERFRTDSIAIPYPVERVVEKNILRWWQKILMYAGGLLFIYWGVRVGMKR